MEDCASCISCTARASRNCYVLDRSFSLLLVKARKETAERKRLSRDSKRPEGGRGNEREGVRQRERRGFPSPFPAMAYRCAALPAFLSLHVFLLLLYLSIAADDASIRNDSAITSPNCNNVFKLVKVKGWVDGSEQEDLVGLNARFGAILPTEESEDLQKPAVLAIPENCCNGSSSKVTLFPFPFEVIISP
ncbi:Signal peptide peptidase-like 3 [Asimina triloba]